MGKLYVSIFVSFLVLGLFTVTPVVTVGQTTITTLPNPPYNGGSSLAGPSNISFVFNNTNPFAVNITGISNWCNLTENGSLWQLYYSSTSLNGASTDVTVAPWTLVANSAATPVTVNGITPLNFPGLSFNVPAGTQYRFVLRNLGPGNTRYSAGTITPNSFTDGGVTIGTGDFQVGGVNTGYSGTGTGLTLTPRYFTGAVTFEAAGPCTNPPVPGTLSSSASNTCLNIPFTLSLSGGTGGTGQTYQWQISPDNVNWTNITGATSPSLTTSQSSTNYYQVIVTCGVSVTSNSVQVNTAASVSGVFTINDALPTGGTNFNSFNDAYDFIKCGINGAVTFNVDPASGPYDEQLIMSPVPGASALNTVTFNGNGRTISFLSTNTNERGVIKLNGADHIRFNNLVINALGTTATEYGFAVHLLNDADSNAITNCTINLNTTATQTNYAGIVLGSSATSATATGASSCDGNLISGNTINGGYYGITIVGSTTLANANNRVLKNRVRDFYSYGIYLLGNFNTLVDSNQISRPARTPVTTFYGVYVTSLNIQVNITRNTISNPCGGDPISTSTAYGVYFTGVDALGGLENKVTNNLLYNFTGNGDIYGFYNTGSDNVWYLHNTLSLDGTGGTGITRGFYQTTEAAGILFQNNIVSITRAGTSTKYAVYFNTATSDILSDRNDFYLNSPTGNAFTGFLGTAQATLLNWQTASAGDLNSKATNPVFTDVIGGNFTPTNASIDNLGAPLGVAVDILGVSRSATNPDAGAYEFTPLPCATPPLGGIAAVGISPVCENTAVQLTLSGNSTGLGQTYQWQASSAFGGPYTNIGNPLNNPDTTIISSVTLFYQVAVSCGTSTVTSTPIQLVVNPALPQNTYTIDAGSIPSPTNFQSFNAAKAAMACGIGGPIIFNVVAGSGPYNEQLILDSIRGTSAINTITFNGNGNTISFAPSLTGERAVIKLRSVDHVIFNDLIIDASSALATYGYGVQLINNADSNTINNCTILCNTTATTTNFAGIVMNASETAAVTTGNTLCDGNTFSNNTITGGYYGITMVGSNTASVAGNKAINNTISDFYSYGIYLNGNFNSLVESNNISRPTRTVTAVFYGVYVTALNVDISISKNRIHKPYTGNLSATTAFYGIYFTAVDALGGLENKVTNNLIYDIDGAGAQYGLYNTGSDNVHYYHNTISLENTAFATTTAYGFYQTTEAAGLELKNNLFVLRRAGDANKIAIYLNTLTTTILSNNNNFYVTGTNGFVGFYNAATRITLADWQGATGQDAISLETDPFFVSPATGNFSPFSPVLDNRGTPVGITTDIVNALRDASLPDIGAYEFTVPPCTAPPVAGNTIAVPSSGICIGTPIALSLAGNSFGSGQTFQWEFSANIAGPWSPLGGPRLSADTIILASSTLYYRCAITCGGNTDFSIPVLVTLNPGFIGGTYTINQLFPTGGLNFNNFADAVAALECGITGPVIFNVAQDTYIEQVRMHAVGGTSASVRVTFQADPANTLPVILTFDATDATKNYVLKLDSASYITYRGITITASNVDNGRAVEIANTASYDSIVNCTINASVAVATGTNCAGIYANLLKGRFNVLKGNTINNGQYGVYWAGSAAGNLSYDHVIDSNTVNNTFHYGMYISFNGRINVNKNTVNLTAGGNTISYGIYSTNSDSAFRYVGNNININGTTTTVYGMYFTACYARSGDRGRIASNTILAPAGNFGVMYGMYQTTTTYGSFLNNVISINTSGATSYGMYSTAGGGNRYWNNTVVSNASSATANVAAYFAQTSGVLPSVNIQNNIFSHLGGGRAMYVTNLNFIYSDYNTFYTTGPVLVQWNAGNLYATLQAWRDTSYWDLNSLAYQPALISPTDLRPDIANPDVWAIHGRGVQIPENDVDFNNNPRPTTLTTGVPDMGAFEFLPTSLPTVLTGTPALPAPNTVQTFMYGTDTVAKFTYSATAPVPATLTLRRYSGVIPPGLGAGQQSMYYYTEAQVPAQGAYDYAIQHFYIDPWQGFIPNEPSIKLGQTDASAAWVVNAASRVDTYLNYFTDSNLVFIDKYTGLTDGTVPPPPVVTYPVDSSNKGTRFWVAYGHHWNFNTNDQVMVLYLSTDDAANVEVAINGTSYKKVYNIPANSVRVSIPIPKYGLVDARITDEGLFERGIRITSDVPIVAYAHIYSNTNSGAGLLLPTGVYGYEYQSLNGSAFYNSPGAGIYTWFLAIADHDSTLVEITPVVNTKGGRPAGVPFQVYLNTGQVYNVMGTISGSTGSDLTGSTIKSIANASGNCYPIAVISGNSRTSVCPTGSGDNFIQQVFPSQAWGKKYLTFSTAQSSSNTNYVPSRYRVMVKDPATVVTRNGAPLTGLIVPGNYYEFTVSSGNGPSGATVIESNKPVMVAQYMLAAGCAGGTGVGDPEMIYISPVEQGIKKAVFYNTNQFAITSNYINVVIPTGGLPTLTIDGVSTFTDVFTSPIAPGYTFIRHNLGAAAAQHIIQSDSAFNAITYGLGSVESYGYNAGTLVKNLNGIGFITNTLGSGNANPYTCAGAPFQFSVVIPIKPTELEWQLSGISSLSPNANVIQTNPVAADSIFNNGSWSYIYTLPGTYNFSTPGSYNVPIVITSPELEGCNSRLTTTLTVVVIAAPTADFSTITSSCFGDPVQFHGIGTTSNGVGINTWNWDFGDSNTGTTQDTVNTYLAPGTYNVTLTLVAVDGCVADTVKQITINPIGTVDLVSDSLYVCRDSSATFSILNPEPGAVYNWYTVATGGSPVFTGTNFTVNNVTTDLDFYVESVSASSCVSERKHVFAFVVSVLSAPVATVDSVWNDRIKFIWNAIPGASGYQVSTDGGANWIDPSSGATGLSHIVTNLLPYTDVTLLVKALGATDCQDAVSSPVTGKTLGADIFIPNTFTPNGDGRNDIFLVYGTTIQSMRMSIFNQWGQKIFESSNQLTGWNGTHKNKIQPSGVYMYVVQATLRDGSTITRKGSINLVR
jgi:gliding motility-associated-like protein